MATDFMEDAAAVSTSLEVECAAAVLDTAHIGDIQGALGTIRIADGDTHSGLKSRVMTLLAILGPGLIVMVGDNDAGAFGTYTQAGQQYGTALLWTLLLLVPVLYVNQEMVLRLGAVTGVGHARLILERFGKFWGAFSVIDLFILNALTIVTEFIGISLGLDFLGLPKVAGVLVSACLIVAAASTGSFKRFERICLVLVAGSLLLVPIFLMVHPPMSQVGRDLVIPRMPGGGSFSAVVMLIIAIVGTTVAPWQLFFQQSYVIDKRITPRFIGYEKIDLWIGIFVVVLGATAMISFTSAVFSGRPEFGHFTDASGVAVGLSHYVSKTTGILFAIALIDASIIGAAAVGLSTSYALGDVFGLKHSLHRKPGDAKAFYALFGAVLLGSALIVLVPGSPLGLLTVGVQVLAGVLLPSATVFLLLLCNDEAVLGPWVNGPKMNAFTSGVIAVLVVLSLVLTAQVLFPDMSSTVLDELLSGGAVITALIGGSYLALRRLRRKAREVSVPVADKTSWRMPPLALLDAPKLSTETRLGLLVLRGYLLIAIILVFVRLGQLALGH